MSWNPRVIFSLEQKLEPLEQISIPGIYSWEEILEIKQKKQLRIDLFFAEDNQIRINWHRKVSEKSKL